MTGALTRGTAGTLFGASPGRLARVRDLGLRQLAMAMVLVLVGGALALCCCTDGPAGPGETSTTAAATALDVVPHRGGPDRHDPAADTSDDVRVTETCGAAATSDVAATASVGRAMPTATAATAVVSTVAPAPPAVIKAAEAQLLDHLIPQASPYRLCVMRT